MKYIKYGIIIVLICILAFITFKLKQVEIDIENAYISIDNNNFIEIKDDNWRYVDPNRLSDFEWNKFNIYSGNEYIGNYNIQYNDRWYIFDDDYNSIDYNRQLFMIKGASVDFYDFERVEFSEDDIVDIKKTLDKLKIVYNNDISGYKIYIDIDNDGVNEVLFNVSSSYDALESAEQETIDDGFYLYNLVYIVKNNKNYFLEKSILKSKEDYYSMPYYDVNYILKIGDSDIYKFVIYKTYFSAEDINCYSVYEFKNNKIKTLLKAELDYGADNNITNNREFSLSTIILTISLLGGIVGFVAIMFYLKQKANNKI